jgi:holliday junction DNA helicase RuvA
MYEYIRGTITELTPACATIECNGMGYFIHISVNTYSQLSQGQNATIYLHPIVREDAHLLFGFADKNEREVFRHLISVSGVGANTARMILSSLSPIEIIGAISSGNSVMLRNIKGIGAKSAERIIVDLRDKIGKLSGTEEIFGIENNTIQNEALSALVMLGFSKAASEKVVSKLTKEEKPVAVEDLIRKALKLL